MVSKYIQLLNLKDELIKEQAELKKTGDNEKRHMVDAQIVSLNSIIKIEDEINKEAIKKWKKEWYGE